jgi:hypothetical protein
MEKIPRKNAPTPLDRSWPCACIRDEEKIVKFRSTKEALSPFHSNPLSNFLQPEKSPFEARKKGRKTREMREESKTNMVDGRRKRAHGPNSSTQKEIDDESDEKKGEAGNGKLTVGWLLEVDIGVAQGATGDDVATDADR